MDVYFTRELFNDLDAGAQKHADGDARHKEYQGAVLFKSGFSFLNHLPISPSLICCVAVA